MLIPSEGLTTAQASPRRALHSHRYILLFVCPAPVPPGNPIIEARDEVLREGNETEMTCTAMSSKPAATIRWMKGDKELPGRRIINQHIHTVDIDSYRGSSQGLL